MKYDSPRREQLSFVQRSDGNGDRILAIPYHSELRGKGKAKGEHIGYYTLQYGFFCIPCDPLNCWIVAHDNRPRSNWFQIVVLGDEVGNDVEDLDGQVGQVLEHHGA